MFPSFEQTEITQAISDIISQNLTNIGALSLEQYLSADTRLTLQPPSHPFESPPSPAPPSQDVPSKPLETFDANAITRLHQACQRTFRNTDPLKFEFVEQTGSRNKQCILTITKPDGVKRSYATQPVFTKKNEAKADAARIAMEMGALEFLIGGEGNASKPKRDTADSECLSSTSKLPVETSVVDEIEKCCAEWRARQVTPHWIAFFEAKLGPKQGCALRIQLSPHVVRVYLSEPTFDTYAEAKVACARLAVSEGVLDFIKYGNGQSRPASPTPSSFSGTTDHGSAVNVKAPWTLQKYYESLPRPFPESFDTNDASEINAPGWLNTLVQNARGGKLMMSFFFTSGGTAGLHGCLLKLDRSEDYRVYLVDARFPKRSDAKAAVCLQAMSQGIGDYIRSITSAVESKVTSTMRSFSSTLVYPTLVSELGKIASDIQPHFEYDRERDAFGATLVVKLSTMPTPEQVRSYRVPCDYRNKADAKVAIICHAAEQGVIEFVRFRGGSPPFAYTSPYTMRHYNPENARKRKQSGTVEEVDEGASARKKKKGKHRETGPSVRKGSHQTHGVPGPGDIGLIQSAQKGYPSDQPQPGYGNEGGSGTVHSAAYGYRHYGSSNDATSYSSFPDMRSGNLACGEGSILGYSFQRQQAFMTHGASNSRLPPRYDVPFPNPGPSPSRAQSRALAAAPRDSAENEDLEPGEVWSSAESESSGVSSGVAVQQGVSFCARAWNRGIAVTTANSRQSKEKGKGKGSSVDRKTPTPPQHGQSAKYTSHMQKLIDHCLQTRHEAPTFHQARATSDDKFEVWIVIGKERFDLPATYGTAEEGWQRVAKQVLARLSKQR